MSGSDLYGDDTAGGLSHHAARPWLAALARHGSDLHGGDLHSGALHGGALDGADAETTRALRRHVAGCARCRGWLDDFALFRDALGAPQAATPADDDARDAEDHPDGELLALWALRPEEVEAPAVHELSAHLSACAACRLEADLVRHAVAAARAEDRDDAVAPAAAVGVSPRAVQADLDSEPPGFDSVPRQPSAAPTLPADADDEDSGGHGALAWIAAAAVVALAIGSLVWLPPLLAPDASTDGAVEAVVEHSRQLRNVELGGERIVESDDTMSVADVTIAQGARVTLRAGRSITLGNGFAVASDARASFGTAAAAREEPEAASPDSNEVPSLDSSPGRAGENL